jgi:endo-1,4-beta-xylanase
MKNSKSIFKYLLLFLLVQIVRTESISAQTYLKDAFKDYYYIGTALNLDQIMGRDIKSIEIIKKHFNSITPENVLKWEVVHPKPGQYNFEPADSFVSFGVKNNMFIIGHCLLWHSQTPKWVFEDENGKQLSRDALLQRLKDHIFSVVGRYKGKINGWDVVNEAVDDDGSLRKSKWFEIIGEDYIEKAFEYAHEADPAAELYYNDYNEWYKGRRETIVKIVNDLKGKGIKIDGIGMQGHWGLDYPPMDEMDASMKAYANTGLKLMITELDMDVLPNPFNYTGADISKRFELSDETNPYPNGLTDSMKVVQTKRFEEYFNLFNKYKDSMSRVTFWGVHDGQSWKNNFPIRGRTAYPLLFDKNLNPKPAYDAIIKTVEKN